MNSYLCLQLQKNANAMADTFVKRGTISSGGTDNPHDVD
jgi:hypothetical protein